ncbi:ABC transporter substrate-binding protein [Bacillus altitudinis]|uniref:nickel ABC transporter substrate-binding protein n=1 Tax=Bacillus altitudinis TaxID=293387 RepID=UPI001071D0D1|nr:nickel ABC transporter substrate-binding protein [Bacillus altitudinis]MED1530625.1 ABC transporter substrate-binding protein [Bacillus altitudinis]QEO60832.1 ABC transporter substrate-binding protein [Bacillus altitudinis]
MRRIKLVIFLLISSLFIFVSACSNNAKENSSKKELTFLFNFPSQTIDPNLDYTPLRAGVTETLVKLSEELKIEPWLAEKWESKDGQNWTFHIREGVTFQNGKALTAASVKKSLERAMKINPGVKEVLNIDRMEAEEQVLKIVTKEPFPQFPSELVHPNTSIIDVDAKNPEQTPVGTGPFSVDSFVAGSSLEVKRNNKYWDGIAKLERASFKFNEDENARLSALKSGGADVVYRPPVDSLSELKKSTEFKVESVVGLRTHELIFNTQTHLFKNEYVRKAFNALVDREELLNNIMSGQGQLAEGPFLPEFTYVPKYQAKETGSAAALKWFKKAGYDTKDGKVSKDDKPLKLKLLTYGSRAEFPIFSQALQSQAKKIGITISINVIENYEDYLLKHNDWDIGMYSPLIAPRGDASYFLNVSFKPKGSLNFSKVDDQKLTSLIDKLDKTFDERERKNLIKQALTYIDEKTYYSYLVHPNIVVAFKDRVRNWTTSKSEYYMLTNQLDVE